MTSEHKETKLLKIQKRPQRVTMETVGRMANVSQVTVSRALSNPSKVSANTLKKIRNAIEATGFVPNASASALASNRSKLISVLVP
ncbi:MAG: LacI family DNA-binding transcriptional regulator, partial [Rhodospirillaceae bacterium]|nr:LacI family DNA-binding transcriptional regulator [Rhodospirillaceae bacterium]